MKGRKVLSLCLALLLAALCCGCEKAPETAAEYTARMQEELSKKPCTKMDMVLDVTVGVDMGPLGAFDMVMKADTVSTVSAEPFGGYTEASVTMDVGGMGGQTLAYAGYVTEEDGEVVSYTETDGAWMRVPSGMTMAQWQAALSDVKINPENVALDETVTEWGGTAAVCLTTQIDGTTMEGALDEVLGMLTSTMGTSTDPAALDYSVLNCQVRIYVDKKTCLPLAQEMTVTGMDELMNQVFSRMAVTVEVKEYASTAQYLSYDKQQVPQMPDGAREKAAVWTRLYAGENDNGDGSFTIGEGMALVDVTAPEGFALDGSGYDYLVFTRDDHRTVRYNALYGDPADFVAALDREAAFSKEHGASVSREQMELAGEHFDFTCEVISNQWTSYEEAQMYAWTLLGNDGTNDFWLMVQVSDGYNDGLGGVKSADITPEEFMGYLNAAVKDSLMD